MPQKAFIEAMFDDIAKNYISFNHISSFFNDKIWRMRAVREVIKGLPDNRPAKMLDIATGTGDFAIEIIKRAPSGSSIVGIDLSAGMLEVGRRRVKGLPIELLQGDATEMPFESSSFSRVSVAFGVRNFENLQKGLREMRRVLEPGGKAVILELSYPRNMFMRFCFKLYAGQILPLMGKGLTGKRGAFDYLTASIMRFPLPEKFIPMLKSAGFAKVSARSFTFGTCRMYIAE